MGKVREIRIEQTNSISSYQSMWKIIFSSLFGGIIYCEMIFTSKLPIYVLAGVLVVVLGSVFFQFVFRRKPKPWSYILAVLIFALMVVVLRTHIVNGFIGFLNSSIASWNDKNGTLFYLFVDGSSNLVLDVAIFMLLSNIVLLFIMNVLVFFQRIECILMVEYFFFILYVLVNGSHIIAVSIANVFAIIGYIFLRNTNREMLKNSRGFWFIIALETIAVTAVTVVLCSMIPTDRIDNLRRKSMYKLEQVIYGDKQLTDGNLEQVGAKNNTTTVRLHVETQSANRLYLKGYVGGRYIGNAWTDIDTSAYVADHREMLQWMMDMQCSDLTLLTLFLYMSDGYKDTGLDIEDAKVTIENVAAYGKYIYTPYTCMNLSFPYYNNIDRDLNVKNTSFYMEDEYTYEYFDINDRKLENLSNNGCLTDEENIKNMQTFFLAEQEYRNFANEYYLEIPKNIRDYLDEELENKSITSAYEVTEYIRTYLHDAMAYTESPSDKYGEDFILGVLENTKEGYDVHYASIATLMFRYYGIPARYVEGFLIDGKKGQAIDVTDKDAHAWVEIYRYGMGWVPIEVTPGMYDEEMEVDSPPPSPQSTQTPVTPPNTGVHEPENKEDPVEKSQASLMDILFILLIVLLILLAIVIIRRNILLHRQKKRIYGEDLNQCVLYMAGIIWRIAAVRNIKINRRLPNLSREEMDDKYHAIGKIRFEKVLYVLMRAQYSNLELTDEEYAVVKSYFELVKKEAMENSNILKRMKLKYVYAVCK